jgi:outer membrane protein TolC
MGAGSALWLTACQVPLDRAAVRAELAATDLAVFRERAPTFEQPLTLADALATAQQYNMDAWVAAQERKYQHELRTQSVLNMLPSMLLGGDSSRRTKFDASSSVSLETGQESLEPSFSAEKDIRRWNVEATWSLLDFGISYFRQQQQAQREQIAAERERRLRQNLSLQVTRVYWQAVTSREIAAEADQAADRIDVALKLLAREVQEQTLTKLDALRRETRLLEQQQELRKYQQAYRAAMTELAALMGVPPGTPFELAPVTFDASLVPPDDFDLGTLEQEALLCRPELFEKDLEVAISRTEAHIAIAQMFPNVSLFWRYDTDRNRYLAFDSWHTAGLRASWDLLSIPQQWAAHGAVQMQGELLQRKRIAIAVAILTQLHLAVIQHDESRDRLALAARISERHRQLLTAVQKTVDEGTAADSEVLDQQMKYLRAHAKALDELAEFKLARARVWNSVGRPPAEYRSASHPPATTQPAVQ